MEPADPSALSPIWELTSTVAEFIAFFMVTVELYGEKNLRALHAWIGSGLKRIVVKIRQSETDDDELLARIGSPVGTIGRIVLGVGAYYSNRGIWGFLNTKPEPPVLMAIIAASALLIVWIVLLGAAITIPLDAIVITLKVVLWLLGTLKLKGIFLLVGALLFVFAKGILIAHSLNELHVRLPWPLRLL